jgi:hypothetical protein
VFVKVDGEDEIEAEYIKRVKSGTAQHGEWVELDFDSTPNVIVSPCEMVLPAKYYHYYEDKIDQRIINADGTAGAREPYKPTIVEHKATDISNKRFKIVSRAIEQGPVQSENIYGWLEEEGDSWESDPTPPLTTDINLHMGAGLVAELRSLTTVTYTFFLKLEKKTGNEAWTTVDQWEEALTISRGLVLIGPTYKQVHTWKRITKSLQLPQGEHKIRVTLTGINVKVSGANATYRNEAHVIEFDKWDYNTVNILATGTANYLAVEGGFREGGAPEQGILGLRHGQREVD